MSIANKFANENHEEGACMTSRHTSKHGLKKGRIKEKRYRNRAAKREEAELAFNDETV